MPIPRPEELLVPSLGPCRVPSPLRDRRERFVDDRDRILAASTTHQAEPYRGGRRLPAFEQAGPRETIFFDPSEIACGIVTCGGLCPGINDVIRALVLQLHHAYGVDRILGFRYGYAGLAKPHEYPPLELNTERVESIHEQGGTILGSSRGPQDVGTMVDTLVRENVKILFTIGGDGTQRGASALAEEIGRRGIHVSVIGIPKTIDNDIRWIDRSFGFATAVEEARKSILGAHAEARGAWNGIGLVKLMGRHSGFITAHATLANADVNFCLVPEVPFALEGEEGFLAALERRLEARRHAVVVIAEGAGQELLEAGGGRDASGNLKLADIGPFLRDEIRAYFGERGVPMTVKYIDPSYTIRSLQANSIDSEFCLMLGLSAVHAGMAGRTDMVVGHWNDHFTHVPIALATSERKKIDPDAGVWQRVLEATGQPAWLGAGPKPEAKAITPRARRAQPHSVAYFTMEIALTDAMPTYSGGLGVLAGDTIRSAADLGVSMVGVTLLHRQGYFRQTLDDEGRQSDEPVEWEVADHLEEMEPRAIVKVEERDVTIRAWRYEVEGAGGHVVPVYFLDADLPENIEDDRRLTDRLYGGDERYRLCQEVLLGIGGVRMLRALGHEGIETYHMNEGHAGLLAFELLNEEATAAGRREIVREDIEAVRERCVFTTHTPVPAGHDQFPLELVGEVLGRPEHVFDWQDVFCVDVASSVFQQEEGFEHLRDLARQGVRLNMTYLALNLSSYVNGVAKRHGEVSREMFGDYRIDSITNGVHAATWAAEPLRELFDRHVPGWRLDNFALRSAQGIPSEEIWAAHGEAKARLLEEVAKETGTELDPEVMTLGFARRAATYKRADLLFTDLERLRRIAADAGEIQVVYAGKAHPRDEEGQALIRKVFEGMEALEGEIPVVYLPDYGTRLGALITSGVDLWLNTPQPPNEASGTSGMKASLNGVPNLSILDGWWVEGHGEGVTGWAIGEAWKKRQGLEPSDRRAADAASLYDQLEFEILPLFYRERERWIDVMRNAIALNGSFFNTQRMMQQYVVRAYFR